LPLEPGDHLTRDEFERRYDAMPEVKKAELIEGVVYMPSPVRWNRHACPHVNIILLLGVYAGYTPGVQAGDNGTLRLDLDNDPQPDGAMIILPSHGGKARLSADDYVEGGPELIVEVAASSASFDLHTKLRVYQRNGAQEYLVWRVLDRAVDWFVLRDNKYEPLEPGPDGLLRSAIFPGLWLDAAALMRGDVPTLLGVLQQGLAAPEHAAFVERLQQAAAAKA
jgi:Uma2 family endonuclease